jgi:hypothetical protein
MQEHDLPGWGSLKNIIKKCSRVPWDSELRKAALVLPSKKKKEN